MSRVVKNPITIPSGVETKVNGQNVEVKGPKGTLDTDIPDPINVAVEENEILVTRPDDHRKNRALHGLSRSLVNKPGLRGYAKSTNLPQVLGGLGVAIISTSQGLLTDRQATEKGVGGEVLAYVW